MPSLDNFNDPNNDVEVSVSLGSTTVEMCGTKGDLVIFHHWESGPYTHAGVDILKKELYGVTDGRVFMGEGFHNMKTQTTQTHIHNIDSHIECEWR